MATILNDRDKALQAAPYRSKLAAVTITGTASAFLASKNTVTISPATITLTATPAGSVYTANAVYTWSYALSSAPNTWVALGTGANLKTQVLNNTDSWVANANVQYRCVVTEPLLDTSYAYYTVTYTKEASEPTVINLSRSNVLVTCDSTGTPTSYNNTDQVITVSRGTSALNYNVSAAVTASAFVIGNSYTITAVGNTNFTLIGAAASTVGTVFIASGAGTGTGTAIKNSADTFTVSYVATSLTAAAGTGSGTSWTQPVITAIALDGATIVYTITVFDSAVIPAATKYTKTVVYNKVNNGVIGAAGTAGADGANLYPVANYDFIGVLPSGVTFPGTVTDLDISTATTIQNTVADQNLRLTNLSLVPANSYIISMRVKFISGTWEGAIYYTNTVHVENGGYYKAITQPAIGVWTTINVDMRDLTAGGTDYLSGGTIGQLRFDFVNDTTSKVAIDYISVGKYGVAEATKSITLSMYQWATSAPSYTGAFTYTWNTGVVSAFPANWTSTAGTAPGNGYTLYQRNIILVDVSTAATTTANWNSSTVNTIGYRNDGSVGVQGDSARTAYAVTTGAWATPTSPTSNAALAPTNSITITGTTVTTNIVTISTPVPLAVGTKITLTTGTNFGGLFAVAVYYVKSFISPTQITLSTTANLAAVVAVSTATGNITGTTNSWSLTATPNLADGQYMYQSDGILNNSTGIITWGVPYLSNLKVGNLSAISANLGVVSIASGGALYSGKTSYSDTESSGFFLGNDGGYAKFRIGTADNSSSLGYDSSTGVLTLKGGSYLNNTGTTLFSPTTVPADIQNSAISLSSAGVLSGAGGGTVTIADLGYSGALDANKTSVDADGKIQGVSSGAGTVIDNSQIKLGGSNFFLNSSRFTDLTNWATNGATVTLDTTVLYAGYNTIKLSGTVGGAQHGPIMRLKASTQYTVSALVKGSAALAGTYDTNLHIQSWTDELTSDLHQETIVSRDNDITTSWKVIQQTFKTPASSTATYCRFYFYPLATGFTLNIAYTKLEEGNKASDWTPNPEEVKNTNVKISSAGVLSGAGGGTVAIADLGYSGALDANKTSVDADGAIQGVSSGAGTAVKNTLVSIDSAGVLSGAGGGTVSITGLGYSGALDANKTSVDADGAIQGVSSGAGTTVSNAITETKLGKDQWLLQRYDIVTAASTAPTYDIINKASLAKTTFISNTTTTFTFSANNYVGVAGCTIYSDSAWAWTVNISHDDNGTIYINGAKVYDNARIGPTSRVINIPAGWSTVELMWAEQAGADFFTLSEAISARTEVKQMWGRLDYSGQVAAAAATATYDNLTGTPAASIANSSVSISSAGVLSGAGGGTVAIADLGYSGALDANKTSVDADGAIQGVSSGAGTAVKNTLVSIDSAGVLSGAGGGTVSITGLGYSGALDANKTSVDADGAIQGVSSGAGTAISNALVETLSFTGTSTMVISGNTLTKSTTIAAAWDAQVYSKDSYIGGAYIRFVPLQTTTNVMAGLNIDPTTNASYTSIDYAWYLDAGTLRIYEAGVEVALAGGATYLVSDVLSITYDGSKVSYYKNGGTAIRTVTVAITGAIYFDSSFNQDGASIGKVDFGPLTSNAWASIGGTGKPADNATVGATIDNMTVAVGANILPNSDFSNGLTNWPINLNPQPLLASYGVNFNAASTLNSGVGDNSNTAYIKHTNLVTDAIGTTELWSDPIPVITGRRYVYSAFLSGHNCSVYVGINFYNAAGGLITGNSSGSVYGSTPPSTLTTLQGYTRKTGFNSTSNSTAAYLRIVLTKSNTASNVTTSAAYFTRVMLQEGGTVATVPGPWSPCGTGKAVVASIATAKAAGDAANIAVTNKLNKSAADTMTGPITLSAENAITVGTPALDGVSGKNGFYIGSNGIVATKDGAATVSISNTGDAIFKGSITGATGTFSGSLNVKSATSGSRIEILSDRINVYNGDVLRVVIGNLG